MFLSKQADLSVWGPCNISLITNFCNFKFSEDGISQDFFDKEIYHSNVMSIICAWGKPRFLNSIENT